VDVVPTDPAFRQKRIRDDLLLLRNTDDFPKTVSQVESSIRKIIAATRESLLFPSQAFRANTRREVHANPRRISAAMKNEPVMQIRSSLVASLEMASQAAGGVARWR
jgi:hypothetical protein